MFRPLALAVVAAFAFAGNARADILTQLGTSNQGAVGGVGTVSNVTLTSGLGQAGIAFQNQYTSGGFPAVGDQVRAIVAVQLAGYNTTSGNVLLNSGANKVVAVFAGNATVTSVSGGNSEVLFNSGQIGVFASSAATAFNRGDPSTWGAVIGNLVTSYGLKPQENVFGPGVPGAEGLNILASDTNVFATNGALGSPVDGFALFRELTDPNNFLNVQNLPPGSVESLIAIVDETVQDPSIAPIDAADIGVLNAIAALLGQPLDIGGFAFATGAGAGPATNFNPSLNLATGDFTGSLGVNLVPGAQFEGEIPEPATMLVFGAMAGVGGLVYRKRRNAKAETA